MPSLALRTIWSAIGVLALSLGAIGAVLPFLPPRPLPSSPPLPSARARPPYRSGSSRVVGSGGIADWRRNGAIALRDKAISLAMMLGALALGLATGMPLGAKIVQVFIMAATATYVLSRPNPVGPTPSS